ATGVTAPRRRLYLVHLRVGGPGDRGATRGRGGGPDTATVRPRRRCPALPLTAAPAPRARGGRVPPAIHVRLRLGTGVGLLRPLRRGGPAPGVPRRVRRHRLRALPTAGLRDALARRRRASRCAARRAVGGRRGVLARGGPAGLRDRRGAPAVAPGTRLAQPAPRRP